MSIKFKIREMKSNLCKRWQRFKHGYSQSDIYNMCDWFLEIIPNMLIELRDNRHGSPAKLGWGEDGHEKYDGACHDEWTMILNQMILLFKDADPETCTYHNKYEEEYYNVLTLPKEDAYREKVWKSYYDEEIKIDAYREQCKNEAFELFSKYFFDLWD